MPLKVQVSLKMTQFNIELFTANPVAVHLDFMAFCSGCEGNVMHTTLADHADLFEEIRFPKGKKRKKQERSDKYRC